MKTILITGATGLVGRALVKALLSKGYVVHYLTTRKEVIVNQENYKGFYWNINSGFIDVNCFKEADMLIHLAGATVSKRWTKKYRKEIFKSRVAGSNLLFSSLQKSPHTIDSFISASGISIFPNSLEKVYSEELQEKSQSFLGRVVDKWEKAAHQFLELGVKTTIVRTGVVLSKQNSALQKIAKPIQMGIGAALGSGKQFMSWIHIEDLVQMYVFLIEKELTGTYNAVAPNPVTNKELTKLVAQQLGKKILLPNVPVFMLKLLLGQMHEIVLESQRVSSEKIKKSGYQFRYPDINMVLKDLL
ncbi:TIGR01777 family oxidoreductase [Pseudofulvibacter geojedonensis]|uniref:TIGR01777 family oxidoreductase n=1 Tax=Pseudofulvibacter geojedonensis TaxID=1123758 RepID=A0ABW3I1Z6_9FLAO